MSADRGTVTVWFTMTSTYVKTVEIDVLAAEGAPVDDVDALADWLEEFPGCDWMTENAREHDCDLGSATVSDIEVTP